MSTEFKNLIKDLYPALVLEDLICHSKRVIAKRVFGLLALMFQKPLYAHIAKNPHTQLAYGHSTDESSKRY